jgi:ribulose-phosphate 3-epimerase
MKQTLIAPSILSADFSRLGEEIQKVAQNGADVIHVDVMDGHFVPNITIGACVVQSLHKVSPLPLDVHLMIENPEKYIPDFIKAGSDWITFHWEATNNPESLIETIHKHNCKAGISIKPATPADVLFPLLDTLDLVLIMSVEPGFGGQKFQPQALDKARAIRQKSDSILISMDGGINSETAPLAKQAGVNILVAGSAIFNQSDYKNAIQCLR